MAYVGEVSVRFLCGNCDRELEAVFGYGYDEQDDTVRCGCGCKYLVTRPFIIEGTEAKEWLDARD